MLFLAVRPPDEIARRIVQAGIELCRQHRFANAPFGAQWLHISLLNFGDYAEFPRGHARLARILASTIVAPRFNATFDRAMTFGGRSATANKRPFVLVAPEGHGFSQLQHRLAAAVDVRRRVPFTPHITLLYDRSTVQATSIEPISWTVDEFVLIHAQVKQPTQPKPPYSIIGRWGLL